MWSCWIGNSLCSIYWNSNTTPRPWGQNCKIFTSPLSRNSQKGFEQKENQTKYRKMTRKPRSHARIVIYRTWAILKYAQMIGLVLCRIAPWDCFGDAIAFFIGSQTVPIVQFDTTTTFSHAGSQTGPSCSKQRLIPAFNTLTTYWFRYCLTNG